MITFEMIGQRIKMKREKLKISQQELADRLQNKGIKISRETISKIESGNRATNALEIKAIGEILEISIEELMKEEKKKDLVSLFRSREERLSEEAESELKDIQDFVKGIIAQKKISLGERKLKRYEPNWR